MKMPEHALTLSAALIAAALFTAAEAGCQSDGHVYGIYGGAATNDGYYDYEYYPSNDVYYAPQTHLYFWYDNDHHNWNHGRDLPQNFHVDRGHTEHLRLHTNQPWTEHHK